MAIIIAALALGRAVWVPLALAFYVAFILTPPSEALERRGVPRSLSLLIVAGAAVGLFVTLSSVLVSQLADLAAQMPTFSTQINQKLAGLEGNGLLTNFQKALEQLGQALVPQPQLEASTVRVLPEQLPVVQRLENAVRPFLEPVAVSGLVVVLSLFVLANREDIRARLIALLGPQNVTVTTQTMDDAVNRISHLLLTQAYINAGFGVVVAIGLHLVGIPYGLLWGAVAGLLRFVPVLGAIIAVLLPSLIAFAIFPGWGETVVTIAMVLVADLIVAYAIEPLVLGRRTGVSSLALLVSAMFWTWLWGPVGLLLAPPLVICGAVIGRHVPQLGFLKVLLGEESGLTADVNFYQRILSGAAGDALRIAKRKAGETSLREALDALLVPALGLTAHDQNHQVIDADAAARVQRDIDDVAGRLAKRSPAPAGEAQVVGIPAESAWDATLLKMVTAVAPGIVQTLPVMERSAAVAEAVSRAPRAVCITAVPPGGAANVRYLCRQLRAQLPQCRIFVLMPSGAEGVAPAVAARLREAGATHVVGSLREIEPALGTIRGGEVEAPPLVAAAVAQSPASS
ncbi:MAG: AI-2E family transporter [Myxococcaceae bacterium]|nr:AI-2E family transporter [Myxococcaceae bacterium]